MADLNNYNDPENYKLSNNKQKYYEREDSYEREKNRDSEKRQKRSKKRSKRSRDKSYSRSRSRSRSGKRNRRRRDYDDYEDSVSGGEDRYYARDSTPDYRCERGRTQWNDGIPNNVLLIRNLSLLITEEEVKSEFERRGVAIREVRLMRSRDTGESLRYCFVELYTVSEAQDWMQHNQGEMRMEDGHTWYMYYSNTRRGSLAPGSTSLALQQDWICSKCTCANFQRRTFCRRCSHAREDVSRRMQTVSSDGSDQVGSNPCNTLLLRGLDGLTTEETISSCILNDAAIQIQQCHVVRDPETGASNGYALVELSSAKEAGVLLKLLSSSSLEVDGKVLIVNYAKNNFNTALATLHTPQNSAPSNLAMPSSNRGFTENAAAAVAQAAMMRRRPQNIPPSLPTPTTNTYPKYPRPDTSQFTYDHASGYYLDPVTNFYYDAKSQYFYNAHLQHFMYWDNDQETYIPVANTSTSTTSTTTATHTTSMASTDKAKKIAKDMERWAKRMNSQKEPYRSTTNNNNNQAIQQQQQASLQQQTTLQQQSTLLQQPTQQHMTSSQAESQTQKNQLDRLEELYNNYHEEKQEEAKAPSPPSSSSIEQQLSSIRHQSSSQAPPTTSSQAPPPTSSSSSQLADEGLVDWSKLTCLLCKRAFLANETLVKHLQMSNLHKTNLAEHLKKMATDNENQGYRDRASERRKKFGTEETDGRVKRSRRMRNEEGGVVVEAPPQPPQPPQDDVASKLMRKMGWKEGGGLGRNLQGIVDPVEATMRQAYAGLGSRVVETKVNGQNQYNDRLKNTFRAYFNDIK